MLKTTRSFRSSLLAALLCGASAASLLAQSSPDLPPAGGQRHGPHANALFDALDTNHDGVISAEEMANAPAALKALLKEGETQLTRADLRPSPPPLAGDEQATPRQPPEPGASRPQNSPANDPAASGAATPPSALAATRPDHPHDRPPFSLDRQALEARWRHRLQEERHAEHLSRLAREDDAETEDFVRRRFGPEDQWDRPRSQQPFRSRRFQEQEADQDGAVSAAEVDQALATLRKLEGELHRLQAQERPVAPVPPQP